jgi:hypothetical protein
MAEIIDLADRRRRFSVLVDNNARFGDERERYAAGRFARLDEAVGKCRAIVDEELEGFARARPGASARELLELWLMFGQDPFVAGSGFSAVDYARRRCLELAPDS